MDNNKIEKVGNVILDLEFYPGEDFYCDGDIEDEILDIVKNNEKDEYRRIIEEKNNWPILYHLSDLRGNIVDWFPIDKNARVLEVGSGCGAITGTLSKKCKELTCIDLSKKRSLINAYRNKDADNITIKVGNFQDIEPHLDSEYDVVCLIGVFEYGAAYINSKSPYTEFLNILKKHVKKDGQIIIAIENRFGLKYFAGCQEDHLGQYFKGIEDYPEGGVVRTFTRNGLEKIFKECDANEYSFYYPYPDYKFAHTIYSDKRLPYEGELSTNLRNFDRDRVLLFDEKNAYDSIIRDGEFPLFANSYFVVLGPDTDVIYSKFSNDRDKKYAIRTDIKEKNGKKEVIKVPFGTEAYSHIAKIAEDGNKLIKRFNGSGLTICPCSTCNNTVSFPFLEGDTLENILDGFLDNNDMDNFIKYVKEYYEKISYNENAGVTDYDLIFPNILIGENNNWQVIDYEWTKDEVISARDILKRALYCYSLGAEKRRKADLEKVLKEVLVDINEKLEFEKLNQDEIKFQMSVTGNTKSLSQMRDSIDYEVLPLTSGIARYKEGLEAKKVQIYLDNGMGFSEDTSIFVMPENAKDDSAKAANECTHDENIIKIKLSKTNINLRFDPAMKPVMIKINDAYVITKEEREYHFPKNKIISNGVSLGDDSYAFNHNDPNVTFAMKYLKKYKCSDGDEFIIKYEVL